MGSTSLCEEQMSQSMMECYCQADASSLLKNDDCEFFAWPLHPLSEELMADISSLLRDDWGFFAWLRCYIHGIKLLVEEKD